MLITDATDHTYAVPEKTQPQQLMDTPHKYDDVTKEDPNKAPPLKAQDRNDPANHTYHILEPHNDPANHTYHVLEPQSQQFVDTSETNNLLPIKRHSDPEEHMYAALEKPQPHLCHNTTDFHFTNPTFVPSEYEVAV